MYQAAYVQYVFCFTFGVCFNGYLFIGLLSGGVMTLGSEAKHMLLSQVTRLYREVIDVAVLSFSLKPR